MSSDTYQPAQQYQQYQPGAQAQYSDPSGPSAPVTYYHNNPSVPSLPMNPYSTSAPPPYLKKSSSIIEGTLDEFERDKKMTQYEFVEKYNIRGIFREKLYKMQGFIIKLVVDDSSSMNEIDPKTGKTRWQELKETVDILFWAAQALECTIELFFLNRKDTFLIGEKIKPVMNDIAEVAKYFKNPPAGVTPMVSTLKYVSGTIDPKKDTVVIIATDGVPTDKKGYAVNPKLMKKEISRIVKKGKRTFVSILACTDDDDVVKMLNRMDTGLPRVEVLDDYDSERKEVLQIQGNEFPYSRSEHSLRVVLGSIDEECDIMDEMPIEKWRKKKNRKSRCLPFF